MKARPVTADSRWQTSVLYGASGTGKTTLAATAPKPLIADSNKGLLSIAGKEGFEGVMSVDVNKMEDIDTIYNNFSGTGKVDWSKKFHTVVFDHFDDVQGIIIDALADKALAKDDRREVDKYERDEWGVLRNKLTRYLRKFKRIPVHKILICAEMTDFDSGRLKPHLLGGLKDELPFFVDHTMYLRIGKKGKRYLHLNSTDDFYAKTRAYWLTPEQRRIFIPEDSTTSLTQLFTLIAAGPKGVVHKQPTRGT